MKIHEQKKSDRQHFTKWMLR